MSMLNAVPVRVAKIMAVFHRAATPIPTDRSRAPVIVSICILVLEGDSAAATASDIVIAKRVKRTIDAAKIAVGMAKNADSSNERFHDELVQATAMAKMV